MKSLVLCLAQNRRFTMKSILCLSFLFLAGCANTPTSGVYYAQAPAQAGACGCASETSAGPGPLMVEAGGAPMLGMQYSVGPTDYVKAGAMIPAEAVVCVGNFAKCLTNVFFPTPTPSLGYVNVIPVRQMQAAPPPKAACAPPPPPPMMQRAPVPEPKKACPEPVSMLPEAAHYVCDKDGNCFVPGR